MPGAATPGVPHLPTVIGALTAATVVAYIRRLDGCLAGLPRPLRTVLRLLGGIGLPRPLAPNDAAARLHVPQARFKRMERQALIRLRERAAVGRCASPEQVREADFLFFSGALPEPPVTGLAGSARAGVASYRNAASVTRRRRRPQVQPLTAGPGILSRSPGADWVIAVSAAALCLIALMVVCAHSFGVIGSGSRRRDT